MHATLVADGARLSGQIRWRLIESPPGRPDMIGQENTVGIEEVTGTMNNSELVLAGISISDAKWLATGLYRVHLNPQDGTFAISNAEGDAVAGSGTGSYVLVK
jgi:hypothetical protein